MDSQSYAIFIIKNNHPHLDLESWFYKNGALGVEILEEQNLKVYFKASEKQKVISKKLKQANITIIESFEIKIPIGNEDRNFASFELCSGIKIASAQQASQQENKTLYLKSGSSFGSGQHPTTLLTAQLLSKIPAQGAFMDLGCGSGILALLAHQLQYHEIAAVEVLDEARTLASMNFKLNYATQIQIFEDIESCPKQHYSIITANMLASTLIFLKDKILDKLSSKGTLILSGIRPQELECVYEKYSAIHWEKEIIQDDWFAIQGKIKVPQA